MKPPVAVARIVVGGLLILAPVISDHLARGQIAATLSEKMPHVTLDPPPMSKQYRFGCWLAGVLMICVAVRGSRSREGSGNG
jgi:hypothetical protein